MTLTYLIELINSNTKTSQVDFCCMIALRIDIIENLQHRAIVNIVWNGSMLFVLVYVSYLYYFATSVMLWFPVWVRCTCSFLVICVWSRTYVCSLVEFVRKCVHDCTYARTVAWCGEMWDNFYIKSCCAGVKCCVVDGVLERGGAYDSYRTASNCGLSIALLGCPRLWGDIGRCSQLYRAMSATVHRGVCDSPARCAPDGAAGRGRCGRGTHAPSPLNVHPHAERAGTHVPTVSATRPPYRAQPRFEPVLTAS